MKILYVEDNDDNVYMLKNRLSRAGFTVLIATSGAQGIAMATSDKPDLILMDITLPDIDGGEATRRIKADPVTKGIPIIALTANAMSGDREKALAAAAMISTPNRWKCRACSKRFRPLSLNRMPDVRYWGVKADLSRVNSTL